MANKPIISVDTGKLQTIAAGDVGIVDGGLRVEENAFVGGNLQVEGDIISGGSQNVVIKDQFLDLGLGATTTAQNTGFTFSVQEGTSATTFSAINEGTGVITVASIAGFADGDIIVVEGSSDAANDGLYYIGAAPAGTSITIDSASQSNAPFLQTAFNGSTTGETGTRLTKVNLAVLAISNGFLPQQGGGTIAVGNQASAYYEDAEITDFTITGYASMATSLQGAYEGGNTIVVDDGAQGALTFNASAAGTDTFTAGATAAFGTLTMKANSALLEGAATTAGSAKVNVVTGGTVQITENGANGLEIGADSVDLIGTADAISRNGSDAGALTLSLNAQNVGTGDARVELLAKNTIKFSTGPLGTPVEQLSISAASSVFNNKIQASGAGGFQFDAGQNMTAVTTNLTGSALISEIASASAIVTYVGGAIAGTSLLGTGDTGTFSVALDGVTELDIIGGSNINTAGAGTSATIALNDVVDVVTSLTVGTSVAVTDFIAEDNMSSNSATALPTQQSVKAYVDSRGNTNYATTLELSTNATAIPAGSVVAIDSSGNAILADANLAGATNVIGFALNATTGVLIESISIAQFGGLGGGVVPGTYAAGEELYLSATTAGAVTTTPPSTGGDTIYRVGTAISANQVAISLQFIAEVL